MPEVRTWYDEFNNRAPEEDWPDEEFVPWFNRGWELAKKIRKRLPLTVDLYYHWKSFAVEGLEFGSVDINQIRNIQTFRIYILSRIIKRRMMLAVHLTADFRQYVF